MGRLGPVGILVLVAALLAGGCGGGGSAATTAPSTTAAATTTAAPTTAVTASTTTTTAPTTTTTTLPVDAHPVIGLSWAAVFPPEGATATYRVTTYQGETLDLPATIEYGVEWRGETWDRFTIGTPEPGNQAITAYFDRSQPWVFKVKALETYTAATSSGPEMVEWFADPLTFDGMLLPGSPSQTDTQITVDFAGGGSGTFGVTYEAEVVDLGGDVEVARGTFGPVAHLRTTIGGEFMSGGAFAMELWLHPSEFLVRATDLSQFATVELLTPWG
jgi:hypothetical protein